MLSWMSRSLTSAWQLPRPPSSAESSSAPSGRLGQRVDLGKQLATLTQDLRAGRDKTIVLLTSSKIAVSAPLGGVCTVRAMSPPGTGVVDVTVTSPGGASATGPQDQFTYQ